MRYRFYNAKILPSPSEDIFDGEILTEDSRIARIGERGAFANLAEKQIDCGGNLLMSGFCNAHTHAAMSLFRGIADDMPLDEWLNDRIFPLEEHLTPEDMYWGAMLQIAEYVRGGITCFADMYFYIDSVCEAAKNANLCVALCGGSMSDSEGDILRFIQECYSKYNTMSDRIRYFPGLHAEYTCAESLIAKVADFAAESGAKTYIHLSETLKEVGECTVRHGGLTPPQYLHKLGFFDNGGFAAHCVYCDKDDIALLKQSGVTPVINGASNLKLASGIAPVYSMLSQGLMPALGTDGTASNNAASMFREMYLFSCLQKEALKDAAAVSAEQALAAATEHGYAALGFPGGALREGYFADMALLDLSAPNMRPLSDIRKSLVYSADTSDVLMTVAGGKIVYDRGNFYIGETLDKIYAECEARRDRLISAL